jgi:hypothetical protein
MSADRISETNVMFLSICHSSIILLIKVTYSGILTSFYHKHTCTYRGGTKISHVRFEVFTTVTMKNAVFWDVTPCGSYKNRHFGGT